MTLREVSSFQFPVSRGKALCCFWKLETGNWKLLLSLLPLLLLTACSSKHVDEPAASIRPVRAVAVETGPAVPPVSASGVLATHDEMRLSFTAGGLIRDIKVNEGDKVHSGQVLAELNPAEVDASLTQARESHEKATRDLQRGQQLYADDVITREQLDDLRTAESVARATLTAAQFNAGHAVIRAPFDGRVLQKLSEAHELVAPGQPVLVVSNDRSGQVLQLQLPDRDYVNVRIGDAATVIFDAFPDRIFHGRISERAQAADPRSGAFPIEIALDVSADDAGAPLARGLIGRAEIAAGGQPGTRSYVPVTALVDGDQKRASLFVVDSASKVHERHVAVAFLSGDRVALAEALPADTRVVTAGAPYLHDGDSVRVVQ
jgi:RND family efflux transporter MFP subunit